MSDASRAESGERLVALDAFRGATVAAMLLVNNPGSWSHIYPPLRHAPWHGWTPTDLIFPFFLFVVGVTTHLAIERRLENGADRRAIARKVVRRGAMIVLLGLVLNAFPFMTPGAIPGIESATTGDRIVRQFETLRIPGVLQRIGIVYLALGLWVIWNQRHRRALRARIDIAIAAAILLGYWMLLTITPVPTSGAIGSDVLGEPGLTIAAWSDRLLFGVDHLWSQSKTWDPEGALSTLPAFVTALIGLMAGRWLSSERPMTERITVLAIGGASLTVSGLLWGLVFPINKNLWTSSYVLLTAGVAAMGIALCLWATEIRRWRGIAAPAVAFGVNPMLAFFGSGIMARLLTSVIRLEIDGRPVPIQRIVYESAFAGWLPDRAASLGYAVSFVLLWLAILWPLWRKGVIWKV